MKNTTIRNLIAVVAILVIGLILFENKIKNPSQKIVAPTPVAISYTNFGIFKNGYEIKIPPNWINTSDLNGHAVIEPGKNGEKVGSFTKIVISVNSGSDTTMTSQEDFDTWYAKSNKELTKDVLQKLDNVTLDGENGVELVDTSVSQSAPNSWSLVTWTRKDSVNYYINAQGNQKITPQDFKVYDYILKSFKFTAETPVLK